jgi:hypothetical protein
MAFPSHFVVFPISDMHVPSHHFNSFLASDVFAVDRSVLLL